MATKLKELTKVSGKETASELLDEAIDNINILDDNQQELANNIPDPSQLDEIQKQLTTNTGDISTLKTNKQGKLIAKENIVLSDNPDGTTNISATGEIQATVSELQKKDKGFIDLTASTDNGWDGTSATIDKIIYKSIYEENIINDNTAELASGVLEIMNHIQDMVEQVDNLNQDKADKTELADYAKKTDIPDVSKLATKDDLNTKANNDIAYAFALTDSDGKPSMPSSVSLGDLFNSNDPDYPRAQHEELKKNIKAANDLATSAESIAKAKQDPLTFTDMVATLEDGTTLTYQLPEKK